MSEIDEFLAKPPSSAIDAFLGPEKPTLGKEFKKGIASGVDNLQGSLYGLVGLAGDTLGMQGVRDYGIQGYDRNQKEAQANAPAIGKFEDIGGAQDAGLYAASGLGSLVPFVGSSIASGGVGGIGANIIARKGAQKAAERGIANTLAEGAIGAATRRGAIAGSAAQSVGVEQGSIYGDIHEKTGEYRPGVAASYGLAAGLLDVIPEVGLINKLAGKTATRGIGREVLGQTAKEAATEAAQTITERGAVAYVDPKHEVFSKDGISDILNAAVIGGLGGAVAGGGTKLYSKFANNKPVEDLKPSDEAPQLAQTEQGVVAPNGKVFESQDSFTQAWNASDEGARAQFMGDAEVAQQADVANSAQAPQVNQQAEIINSQKLPDTGVISRSVNVGLDSGAINPLTEIIASPSSGNTAVTVDAAKSFPFSSDTAAQRRASYLQSSTGNEYVVVPHPVATGSFAVAAKQDVQQAKQPPVANQPQVVSPNKTDVAPPKLGEKWTSAHEGLLNEALRSSSNLAKQSQLDPTNDNLLMQATEANNRAQDLLDIKGGNALPVSPPAAPVNPVAPIEPPKVAQSQSTPKIAPEVAQAVETTAALGNATDYTIKNGEVKQFRSAKDAELFVRGNKKALAGYQPRQDGKTWVLTKQVKPKTPAQQKAIDQRNKDAKTVYPDRDHIYRAIAKMGGIDKKEAISTWGLDPKDYRPSGVFRKPTLRYGGLSIDDMGQKLAALGYLPVDEHGKYDAHDFEDAFANGVEHFTPSGHERNARLSDDARYAEEQAAYTESAKAATDGVPETENLDADTLQMAIDIAEEIAQDEEWNAQFDAAKPLSEYDGLIGLGFTQEEENEIINPKVDQGKAGQSAEGKASRGDEGGTGDSPQDAKKREPSAKPEVAPNVDAIDTSPKRVDKTPENRQVTEPLTSSESGKSAETRANPSVSTSSDIALGTYGAAPNKSNATLSLKKVDSGYALHMAGKEAIDFDSGEPIIYRAIAEAVADVKREVSSKEGRRFLSSSQRVFGNDEFVWTQTKNDVRDIPKGFLKRIQVEMPAIKDDGGIVMQEVSATEALADLTAQEKAYKALRACLG